MIQGYGGLIAPIFDYHDSTYIPIDFIKAKVIGVDVEQLKNNTSLNFIPKLGIGSEIKYEHATRDGLTIKVFTSGYTELSGSLHKFLNDGEHNHDQFSFKRFIECLNKLYQTFKITPLNLIIMQLEVGYNITPPTPAETLLNGLIEHKGIQFSRVTNSNQHYTQIKRDEYCFKVYDKGLQYKLPMDCIRVELKILRFCRYRTEENATLHDFILSDKTSLFNRIVKLWNEVTFYDHRYNQNQIMKYANFSYWQGLRKNTSGANVNKQKTRLKQLNSSSGRDTQKDIERALKKAYLKLKG